MAHPRDIANKYARVAQQSHRQDAIDRQKGGAVGKDLGEQHAIVQDVQQRMANAKATANAKSLGQALQQSGVSTTQQVVAAELGTMGVQRTPMHAAKDLVAQYGRAQEAEQQRQRTPGRDPGA